MFSCNDFEVDKHEKTFKNKATLTKLALSVKDKDGKDTVSVSGEKTEVVFPKGTDLDAITITGIQADTKEGSKVSVKGSLSTSVTVKVTSEDGTKSVSHNVEGFTEGKGKKASVSSFTIWNNYVKADHETQKDDYSIEEYKPTTLSDKRKDKKDNEKVDTLLIKVSSSFTSFATVELKIGKSVGATIDEATLKTAIEGLAIPGNTKFEIESEDKKVKKSYVVKITKKDARKGNALIRFEIPTTGHTDDQKIYLGRKDFSFDISEISNLMKVELPYNVFANLKDFTPKFVVSSGASLKEQDNKAVDFDWTTHFNDAGKNVVFKVVAENGDDQDWGLIFTQGAKDDGDKLASAKISKAAFSQFGAMNIEGEITNSDDKAEGTITFTIPKGFSEAKIKDNLSFVGEGFVTVGNYDSNKKTIKVTSEDGKKNRTYTVVIKTASVGKIALKKLVFSFLQEETDETTEATTKAIGGLKVEMKATKTENGGSGASLTKKVTYAVTVTLPFGSDALLAKLYAKISSNIPTDVTFTKLKNKDFNSVVKDKADYKIEANATYDMGRTVTRTASKFEVHESTIVDHTDIYNITFKIEERNTVK